MKHKLNFMKVADSLPVAYDALARDTDIQSAGGGLAFGSAGGGVGPLAAPGHMSAYVPS